MNDACYSTFEASHGGHPMRTWDDSWGPLWIYVDTMGPVGMVRARTFEQAYEIVIDEIMCDADPEDPCSYARDYDGSAEEGELAEGVHHRDGVPAAEALKSPLAQEDLGGALLLRVTGEVVRRWGLKIRLVADLG